MSTYDQQTIDAYDRESTHYAKWSGRNRSFVFLDRMVSKLPNRGVVLDAGCGAGWDSERLVSAGFRVVSIDASQEQVDSANCRPGVSAERLSFDQLEGREEFDAVWANSTLQHVSRADLPSILAHLAALLKTGGFLFATIHEGSSTQRDSYGRLYCHYTCDDFTGLLSEAGLKAMSIHRAHGIGYEGSPNKSMLFESRKVTLRGSVLS